jgi:hypothetical protein
MKEQGTHVTWSKAPWHRSHSHEPNATCRSMLVGKRRMHFRSPIKPLLLLLIANQPPPRIIIAVHSQVKWVRVLQYCKYIYCKYSQRAARNSSPESAFERRASSCEHTQRVPFVSGTHNPSCPATLRPGDAESNYVPTSSHIQRSPCPTSATEPSTYLPSHAFLSSTRDSARNPTTK